MDTEKQRAKRKGVRLEQVGRRVDEVVDRAAEHLDARTEQLIAYLNDEVVPAIRKRSSRGLRTAAEKLAQFAEYLESGQQR